VAKGWYGKSQKEFFHTFLLEFLAKPRRSMGGWDQKVVVSENLKNGKIIAIHNLQKG